MRVAIIGNGTFFNCQTELQSYDKIIAADGGANYCDKLGITPDLIIGDFDSITKETLHKYKDIEQAVDNNEHQTDIQKAINLARELAKDKADSVDLFFVISDNRIDHTLAAINCVVFDDLVHAIMAPNMILRCIDDRVVLTNQQNKTASIIPYTENVVVTLYGFKWQGENIKMQQSQSGISNIITQPTASIDVQTGKILLAIQKHETKLP